MNPKELAAFDFVGTGQDAVDIGERHVIDRNSAMTRAEANQFGELADLQPISSVFHESIMEASSG